MLSEDLTLSVGSRDLPDPVAGEARVAVRFAGLCGSDLHVIRSGEWVTEWPATLGHEIFAEVEAIADGQPVERGDRVVVDSRLPCNSCPDCELDPNQCPHLRFIGEARPGGFAEYCLLPISSLHRVPDALAGEVAVLAEPLAVVVHALSKLRCEPHAVAVLGHGPIGALLHLELRRRFPVATFSVAEPSTQRRAMADELGAMTTAGAPGLEAGAFDLVIDAAGYPQSLSDAIKLCSPGAQLLLLAISDAVTPVLPIDLVERRLTVIATNAFVDELPQAIELLNENADLYRPLVTDVITLQELPAVANSQLDAPSAVKVLVQI